MESSRSARRRFPAGDKRVESLVDPKRTGWVDIENIVVLTQKAIVTRFPAQEQSLVSDILKSFVYEERSFSMPVHQFLKAYNSKLGLARTTPRPILKKTQSNSAPRVKYSLQIHGGTPRMISSPKAKVSFSQFSLKKPQPKRGTSSVSQAQMKQRQSLPKRRGYCQNGLDSILAVRQRHLEYCNAFKR